MRISVNDELSRLKGGLAGAFQSLNRCGRLGVISFHSLEDRIVKHFFREHNKSCTCPPDWPICKCGGQRALKVLTKKPVTASPDEIGKNPASRSARLRVVEKLTT
ncbi:Ribosomal RNA small subunit methyltransferase H [subsurface metagenome]